MKYSIFSSILVFVASVYSVGAYTHPSVERYAQNLLVPLENKLVELSSTSQRNTSDLESIVFDIKHTLRELDIAAQMKDASYMKLLSSSVQRGTRFLSRSIRDAAREETVLQKEITYYAESFVDKPMANGVPFQQYIETAAVCETPLGNLLQVRTPEGSILVPATDRPNCSRYPNVVDLSTSAFEELGSLRAGRLVGTAIDLGNPGFYPKKYRIPTNAFETYGVTLDTPVSSTFWRGETVVIRGRVSSGQSDHVLLVIIDGSGKQSVRMFPIRNQRFEANLQIDTPGEYGIILSQTNPFRYTQDDVKSISVLPDILLDRMHHADKSINSFSLKGSELRVYGSVNSDAYFIDLPQKNSLGILTVVQGGRKVRLIGQERVGFSSRTFAGFSSRIPATVTLTLIPLTSEFSTDMKGRPETVYREGVFLGEVLGRFVEGSISAAYSEGVVRITGTLSEVFESTTVYITHPDGSVTSQEYIPTSKAVNIQVPVGVTAGTYRIELMTPEGVPIFNEGISIGKSFPVLPVDFTFSTEQRGVDLSADELSNDSRAYINTLRAKQGAPELKTDATLTKIALFKAEDMAKFNYFSHTDSQGEKIIGTAERAGYTISTSLGENIASGSRDARFLSRLLAYSGGHRLNMLHPRWTRVGVAAVKKGDTIWYVQVFGE